MKSLPIPSKVTVMAACVLLVVTVLTVIFSHSLPQ